MKKPYYISTAIAYSSSIPHIGNVYEIILADAIARFKRLDGYDVYFQTGTDEHGQKIENKAKSLGVKTSEYVNGISSSIKDIFDEVMISYDKFVRTTDPFHVKAVQAIFDKLYKQGDIYLGKYEGWYSLAEEAFVFEKDLVDGKTANGDTPIWMSEEVYFLKLSKYQDRLIKHITENENFIYPESRKNEMIQNFLSEPLPDLSVSRTSFNWGVPVSFDKKHVIYVWIDALSNYITGLGYNPDLKLTKEYEKYWPADVHLIGKDILRFHTIYWPVILMALDLPLPKQIFGHPWILFNKGKMSKSTGNVMYTKDVIKHFSVDVLRYYCLHEIPYLSDGNITYELLIERNNSDLANTIGNLVNRTIGMALKYRNGVIKKVTMKEPFDLDLKEKALVALPKIRELLNELKVADALEEVLVLARFANKYIDVSEPWALFKDESKSDILDHVLYTLAETIRFIASLLQPFIPETANKIKELMKITDMSFASLADFGQYHDSILEKSEVLFTRYDLEEKIKEILKDQ